MTSPDPHTGTPGNDTLYGSSTYGQTVLDKGFAGNDLFIQGADNAFYFGGDGADTFLIDESGSYYGKDYGSADMSSDVYAIQFTVPAVSKYNVSDTIYTFTQGVDKIDLSSFHAVHSIADLALYHNTPSSEGFNLVNSLGHTTNVVVNAPNFAALDLKASDFIFFDPSVHLVGDGQANSLSGAEGNDTLEGQGGNDTLFGDTGNDSLLGGDDNDVLRGSHGNDTIDGGAGNDSLWGSEGDDTLYGGIGDDSLNGGDAQDRLYGGSGNDTLRGEDGNDKLYGGDDNDSLYGGNGNDSLHGEGGDDKLNGDAGNDHLYGGEGQDTLIGGIGEDTLYGQGGDDRLYGEEGNDLLVGNLGDDQLIGGAGNDTLVGGGGRDLMVGGTGADVFLFNSASETGFGSTALRDKINDFSSAEGDKIDLSALHLVFLSAGKFTVTGQAQAMFEYHGSTTLIDIDRNGEGHTDAQIEVSGAHLQQSDLIL